MLSQSLPFEFRKSKIESYLNKIDKSKRVIIRMFHFFGSFFLVFHSLLPKWPSKNKLTREKSVGRSKNVALSLDMVAESPLTNNTEFDWNSGQVWFVLLSFSAKFWFKVEAALSKWKCETGPYLKFLRNSRILIQVFCIASYHVSSWIGWGALWQFLLAGF